MSQGISVRASNAALYWRLYDEAFASLRLASPHRQDLSEDEFREQMSDERVVKFGLWAEDELVGLSLLATDLAAVPWLSEAYFANRFPVQYAEGRIYYLSEISVAPNYQRKGHVSQLLAEVVNYVLSNNAIIEFDCAGVNSRIVPRLSKLAMERQAAHTEMEELDREHYYILDATGFRPSFGPGEPFGRQLSAR